MKRTNKSNIRKSRVQSRKRSQNKRIAFILVFFILLSIIILAQLFKIQIIESSEYRKKAVDSMTRSENIVSDRGDILDRNGKKLAINISASTVYVNPEDYTNQIIKDNKTMREIVASDLSSLLNRDYEEILDIIQTTKRVKVEQWIDRDLAMEIRNKNIPGVEVVDGTRRFYPKGTLASHVLGFTNVDNVGQYGIEASYNDDLAGFPGRRLKTADAKNRQMPFAKEKIYEPDNGLNAVLTIDENIQEIAQNAAKRALEASDASAVTVIIQEPATGDILAMVDMPEYNPNLPREAISDEQNAMWKELDKKQISEQWYSNWRNFAVNDLYEPGSTFKIITAAAALENNSTNPNKHYYCTGYIRDIKGSQPLKCVSYKEPHGDITMKDGLAKSCNPTFVHIARELGKESFYKYIKAFGFGEKTGIMLPAEQAGIIPKSVDEIKEINLATMSYGHGIAVTPIQLINAASAIANDGKLMVPRIVKEFVDNNGKTVKNIRVEEKRQIISEETAKTMLDMMNYTVDFGSGKNAAVPGYRIGGKTGTANRVSADGKYGQDQYISSFVGMAPIEKPRLSVLLIVDNPKGVAYGSQVAAPFAAEIFEKTLNYLGIEPSIIDPTDNNEIIEEDIVIPDVQYMYIGDAGKTLALKGLKYSTEYIDITDNTLVKDQFPKAGDIAKHGDIIDLYLEDNKNDNILPNFNGKTSEEIEAYCDKKNIILLTEGEGYAYLQEPKAGSKIAKDMELKIYFKDPESLKDIKNIDEELKDGIINEEKIQKDAEESDIKEP
ncbi:MAG: penicillin-binding transpeptidase domain-containing protein [Tissierellia bacterium]|nr:penicillin-binding transpeptidase domain-containing protein [Tissierellia bacterium]